MPVTTETFRSQNKLHWWFAASSVLLVIVTLAAVIEDWANDYRSHQLNARVWDGAMAEWDNEIARYKADQAEIDELRASLAEAEAKLQSNEAWQDIRSQIAELETEKSMLSRYLGLEITGNIAPVEQRIEWLRALIQTNEGTSDHEAELAAVESELAYLVREKREGENRIQEIDSEIASLEDRASEIGAEVSALRAQVDAIQLNLEKAEQRFKELNPGLWAWLGQEVRNAPLLDWMNPSIKIDQQLVPGVLTQLNLAQTPTLDRCMTCHVNIDNDAYTEEKVLDFLERQIAVDDGARLLSRPVNHAVVMLDFWERAVTKLSESKLDGAPGQRMASAQADYIGEYNALLRRADVKHPIRSAWQARMGADKKAEEPAPMNAAAQLASMIAAMNDAEGAIDDWAAWYEPASDYREALEEIIDDETDEAQRRALYDTYRYALVDRYNEAASESGRRELNASRVMLAHPKLDLYAHPDSAHPIASMGCTSCHAGSGEETQFVHSAHVPGDVWVDENTGMLIPDFLVEYVGDRTDVLRRVHRDDPGDAGPGESARIDDAQEHTGAAMTVLAASYRPNSNGEAATGAASNEVAPETGVPHVATAAPGADEHGAHESVGDGHHESAWIHDDHFYADPSVSSDPFGPTHDGHGEWARYFAPGTAQPATAVKQRLFWASEYGWHEVEYHYWERPMHELRYVESSCARCHQDIMDIDYEATTLARGRYLFGELGCVDCHANDRLGSPLRGEPGQPDIRQVGPSLAHVRHKLSEDMIASWTFAPKAFRPNTRMPHFWLLENNSSPMEIRRSRAEVGAIAYYLAHTNEAGERIPEGTTDEPANAYEFEPLPVNESGAPLTGDARAGRETFTSVGCLACHANVNESGFEWVALDLQERFGYDRDEARERMARDAQDLEDLAPGEVLETNVGFFELDSSGDPTTRIRPDQYTRLQWYLQTYQPDRFSSKGPDLSGLGTKLLHDRTEAQATGWLYNWVRNPSHYSSYTIMPELRLTEQEALDIAAYLLDQKHPTYEPQSFPPDEQMVDALLVNLQANAISTAAAQRKVESMSLDDKVYDLGDRMIQHYGCFGCHEVNGFDSSMAVSANVSSWGTRDPHLLDFGFFSHIYEHSRPATAEVWKAYRSGLSPDAVKIEPSDVGPHGVSTIDAEWEHVDHSRRGYLEAKLYNTRIFDRYRLSREGAVTEDNEVTYVSKRDPDVRLVKRGDGYVELESGAATSFTDDQVRILSVGQPYLKLRMPNFFLRQSDVDALVTYVTSQMDPLVERDLQDTTTEAGQMRAEGKLMALTFNCFGCHNIERNQPLIQQYYAVRRDDGEINYSATMENLVNAPPRLIGNGAKTQHDWFYEFLNNVEMIRPWLNVRMPSFNLTPDQTEHLVQYLAGAATHDSRELAQTLEPIESEFWSRYTSVYGEKYDEAIAAGEGAIQADLLAKNAASQAAGDLLLGREVTDTREAVLGLAEEYELVAPALLPNRENPDDERAMKYARLVYDFDFLRDTYEEVNYPFPGGDVPVMDELEFRRGERIIEDLGCLTCHVFGDTAKLEQIFNYEQEQLAEMMSGQDFGEGEADPYGEDDPYGDDPYGDAEDGPYGEDQPDPEAGDAEEEDPYGYGDAEAEADDYGYGDEGDPYADDPYGGGDEEEAAPAEPAKPSLYDSVTAPNLGLAHARLQATFIEHWLRKPSSIQPGTKMPHHWGPDGNISAFAAYPDPMRSQKEGLYGRTADEQIDLIVKWLQVAGRRGHTMGEEKLREINGLPPSTRKQELDAILDQQASERIAAWAAERAQQAEAEGDGGESPAAPEVEATPAPEPEPERPRPSRPSDLMDQEAAEADREAAVSAAMSSGAGGAEGGRVVGLAIFNEPVRPRRIAGNADCQVVHRANGTMLVNQEVTQNANRTLANVLVYVKEAPAGGGGGGGAQPIIDQVGCMYLPHVVSLTAGERVTFRNSDPFSHNLSMTPEANPAMNVGQPAPGMVHQQAFPNPERNIRLKCDVHSWMGALIHVFDHPYHAVTDDTGMFDIAGLPDGDYTLVFSHEQFGEQEFPITVTGGAVARQDVDYTR